MQKHFIEDWALRVIERVKSNQPVEDARVELKRNWPASAVKAARRIAGHANAAQGQPILWLVGVDEKSGAVIGIDYVEISSWFESVRSCFDELAPELIVINVPIDGVTVAALCFETDRAPYVVTNPEGGAVQREVPWREATAVKSATRSQLLRLLSPLQKLPEIELVGATLSVQPYLSPNDDQMLAWTLYAALFLAQPGDQQTVIASHRSTFNITIPGHVNISSEWTDTIAFCGPDLEEFAVRRNVMTIWGSGIFEVRCHTLSSFETDTPDMFREKAIIRLQFKPASELQSLVIDAELGMGRHRGFMTGYWETGAYMFVEDRPT